MTGRGKARIVRAGTQDFNGARSVRELSRAVSPNTLRSRMTRRAGSPNTLRSLGGSAVASGMMVGSVRRGA